MNLHHGGLLVATARVYAVSLRGSAARWGVRAALAVYNAHVFKQTIKLL